MASPPTEEELISHLSNMLAVSSGMLGVCLSAIGLIGVMKSASDLETTMDDVLAADALVYLVATALCFAGLRTRLRAHMEGVVKATDIVFFLGLALSAVASVILAFLVL